MTNYEKLMQIMPKETLAHLLVEKGTYNDKDWEFEYFRFLDEYYVAEEEAYKDALEWLNKEVSLEDIAYILNLPDTEE